MRMAAVVLVSKAGVFERASDSVCSPEVRVKS